jgi:hypothetical protein
MRAVLIACTVMNKIEKRRRRVELKAAERERKRQRIPQPIVETRESRPLTRPLVQPLEKGDPGEKNTENHSPLKNEDRADQYHVPVLLERVLGFAAPLLITIGVAFAIYFLQANKSFPALLFGLLTWFGVGLGIVSIFYYVTHSRGTSRKIWGVFALWTLLGLTGAFLINHIYLKAEDISNGMVAENPRSPATKSPETLHEYFDADFRNYYALYNPDFLIMPEGHPTYHTEVRLIFDWQSRTKFLALYLPSSPDTQLACEVPLEGNKIIDQLLTNNLEAEAHFPGERGTELKDLQFSGRIFIYHEDPLMPSVIDDLTARYKVKGLDVRFRGLDYVLGRNRQPHLQDTQPAP